jgi:hypothetical protein
MSTDTERLTAVIGRRVRAIVATFRRPAQPPPEFYGLSVGHVDSTSVGKERPSKPDISSDHVQATQAYLPIGPSCC